MNVSTKKIKNNSCNTCDIALSLVRLQLLFVPLIVIINIITVFQTIITCVIDSYLCKYTRFYISNTFISNAKLKQMLSSTLRPNVCYMKIIHILHPHYHPNIIGYKISKRSASFLMRLYH